MNLSLSNQPPDSAPDSPAPSTFSAIQCHPGVSHSSGQATGTTAMVTGDVTPSGPCGITEGDQLSSWECGDSEGGKAGAQGGTYFPNSQEAVCLHETQGGCDQGPR